MKKYHVKQNTSLTKEVLTKEFAGSCDPRGFFEIRILGNFLHDLWDSIGEFKTMFFALFCIWVFTSAIRAKNMYPKS